MLNGGYEKKMIKTELKECCGNCKFIDINTDTAELFGDRVVRIWCKHNNVCAFFNAPPQEKKEEVEYETVEN